MTVHSRKDAEALDAADPLAPLREHFDLPEGVIYLDGNSLGPPPRSALKRLHETAHNHWGKDLIKSWNTAGWIDLPKTCGAKIATLVGADPNDVIVCDSVSVNIFKLASALLKLHPGALAYEQDEFPTDGYILQGLANLTNSPLIKLNHQGGPVEAFAGGASVLIKSAVHYKTAAIADIAAWEAEAGKAGAVIIWDLSHAAGVINLDLEAAGARFAVGCGYKYLNGGPGAPAFVYAQRKAAEKLNQPLSGWMGHAHAFDFAGDYAPGEGVKRFACGTPPILSMSVLDAALDVFADIDMSAVEAKAKALGDIFLLRAQKLSLESVSPGIGESRGGHVSLKFKDGYAVVQALIARGVIGDFRTPDLMRFGFAPLYLGYSDVWDAADAFEQVMTSESWNAPEFITRKAVI
ncbi:aminotransferase class V-fold PLP-dependent enzyme [Hyphococcus flavus]|uniref:Kynureninase n=1 Tax=Hyphococcus flavus TaxID=1866326 RepID=A0AAE9ZCC6_9PROT|nr:aminotransferase class V-fold PLP-dependent enzyme [Hyphococcus flavus]WDI30322.1 aminotransferase class V-fold PLP-dependent enzyme [Hyphococcus flavus]